MNGRLTRYFAFAAAALLTALPGQVSAQGSRYRVLVPDFYAVQGAKGGFGKDVATELRTRLDKLGTHAPIPDKELKESLVKFKMKMEDLDCLKTRQLATQMNANLALCASFSGAGDAYKLSGIEFWDMTTGEPLDVPDISVSGKDAKLQAADQIFKAFDQMIQLAKSQQFCADYANSQQWDNAIENCDKALALNPNAVATRLRKAQALIAQAKEATGDAAKKDFNTKALAELKTILAANEFHEAALQLAGVVSIQLGQPEEGRKYFYKYLEVNPGADQIRLSIAYDMAQAGDPEGAMGLVKTGIDAAPKNADLLEYYASYGVAAASKRDAVAAGTPEAVALYKQVIDALTKDKEVRGTAMTAAYIRMLVQAKLAAGDPAAAEAEAQTAVQAYPKEAAIYAQMAEAQQRQGKIDAALAMMEKVKEVQPDYPSLRIRQASWLLGVGRVDDAVPYLKKAVEDGTDPNTAAKLIYGDAVAKGINKKPEPNWPYALKGLTLAKSFEVNAETRSELDFWHAWSIYHQAMLLHTPAKGEPNMASATVVKPMFEQAKALFTSGRAYAAKAGVDLVQIGKAVDTYIEIETVLIKRGR